MTRLEDWVDERRIRISRLYMTAGIFFSAVGVFRPTWGMPGMAFATATVVLRRDDLLRAVRMMGKT